MARRSKWTGGADTKGDLVDLILLAAVRKQNSAASTSKIISLCVLGRSYHVSGKGLQGARARFDSERQLQ